MESHIYSGDGKHVYELLAVRNFFRGDPVRFLHENQWLEGVIIGRGERLQGESWDYTGKESGLEPWVYVRCGGRGFTAVASSGLIQFADEPSGGGPKYTYVKRKLTSEELKRRKPVGGGVHLPRMLMKPAR